MGGEGAWKEIGLRLRNARRGLLLSKRAAAAKAGISEGLWRQLEAGERSPAPGVVVPVNPRDETLMAAASAVGLDPAPLFEIVGREYEEPRQPAALSGVLIDDLPPEDQATVRELVEFLRSRREGRNGTH